jgi:hypothetical protein
MGELCEGGDTETDSTMRIIDCLTEDFTSRSSHGRNCCLIKLMSAAEVFVLLPVKINMNMNCHSIKIKQTHPIH